MYEPLLDVGIPNEVATPGRSFHSGCATGEKIVVLQQIYSNSRCQENVLVICRQLAREAGVRLIAVEGADGRVSASTNARSIQTLLQSRCALSAGVQVFINDDRRDVEVWGVDDLESEARSAEAMDCASKGRKLTEHIFQLIRSRLKEAQRRCYSKDFARLRRLQCAVYGKWQEISQSSGANYPTTLSQPFSRVIVELFRLAPKVGIDLRSFPALPLYHRLLGVERRFNQRRAKVEQSVFIKRLITRVFAGTEEPGVVDLSRVEPVIEFWAEQNGIMKDELNEYIQMRGFESMLSECFEWLISWLTEQAISAQSGRSGSADIVEQMQLLALRLSVPYFDLKHFRMGVAYMHESNELSSMALFHEVDECAQTIASQLSIDGSSKLFEIEESLEKLYLALRLELIPTDAESTDISLESLTVLTADVIQLANRPAADIKKLGLKGLSRNVVHAHEFYRRSLERGRMMATKTLELIRSHTDDRAILVAGGFHERAITRTLEDNRDTSWSVLLPQAKV